MLNLIHGLSQASMRPLNVASALSTAWLRSPLFEGIPGIREAAATTAMLERGTRHFGKPDWGLNETRVARKPANVRPVVAHSLPFCDLVRFERSRAGKNDLRVLVVAPLSGHWATLLRGTVEALLPNHDVYVTDWRDASDVPLNAGSFGFDGYVDYILRFLRYLGPDTHVLAVCQPTVPVLAAVSLLARWDDQAQPRSMTLMGGPIDVAAAPTAVTRLADDRSLSWFRDYAVGYALPWRRGAGRRIYAGWRQLAGFISMNHGDHVTKHAELFRDLARGAEDNAAKTQAFYDEYMSVMDLDGDFYIETVDRVFQRRLLPQGRLDWRGERVDPSAIRRTALMTVEGAKDDISAPGQTLAAQDLCSSLSDDRRLHHLQPAVGHYGLFNGRRWREEICPRVTQFMRAH